MRSLLMVALWSDCRLGAFLYLGGDGSKGASHSLKISTDARVNHICPGICQPLFV